MYRQFGQLGEWLSVQLKNEMAKRSSGKKMGNRMILSSIFLPSDLFAFIRWSVGGISVDGGAR